MRKRYLLPAEVTDEIAFVGVKGVAVRDLLGLVGEPLRAVLALVGQRIVVRRVLVQMLLEFEVGLEPLAAQFTGEHELFVLHRNKN